MPDHRFMYPKVVPLLHNFAAPNVRIALQGSGMAIEAPKNAADFIKSDGGHYREASVR